jgi:hypothetical protein
MIDYKNKEVKKIIKIYINKYFPTIKIKTHRLQLDDTHITLLIKTVTHNVHLKIYKESLDKFIDNEYIKRTLDII